MGSSGLEGDKAMKASIFSLILASASAKPQFEALKSVFGSGLEQAPYTTLKEFDGYEMRQYQSVNWVCTEATYKMERLNARSNEVCRRAEQGRGGGGQRPILHGQL